MDVDATHPALRNFDVLLQVFQYLPLEQIREIRTVSKDWEDPASYALGTRTHLDVTSLCSHYDGIVAATSSQPRLRSWKPPQTPTISPHLAKRVAIKSVKTPGSSNSGDKTSCQTFLSSHAQRLQEIVFSVDWDFCPTLAHLLKSQVFSNLRKISIQEKLSLGKLSKSVNPSQNLPYLPNITQLEFDAGDGERGNKFQTGHRYLSIFQEMINKSPNLSRLSVTGNVYLELNSALRLKSLTLINFPVRFTQLQDGVFKGGPVIRRDFSIQKLEQMLAGVKGWLQELKMTACLMSIEHSNFDSFELRSFNREQTYKLPSFPNLVSLGIHPINGFLQQFAMSPQSFPSLTKLDLSVSSDEALGHFDHFLTSMGPSTTVTQLSFNVRHERGNFLDAPIRERPFESVQKMASNFPNVRKLELFLKRKLYDSCILLADMGWMADLGQWGLLEDLTLKLECMTMLSKLLRGIDGTDFHGLKSLKLIAHSSTSVIDEGSNNFPAVFQTIPKIYFKGFSFLVSTYKQLMNFNKPSDRYERIRFGD